MMFKLFGASLIIIATTWIGFATAHTYRQRPKQIRQLRTALSLLETEIGYGIRPLEQACRGIALRLDGAIATLFATCADNLSQFDGLSTYECFSQAINQVWKQTALKKSEKAILLDFSKTVGTSDREDQLHHLEMTSTNLEVVERQARDEQLQYEKMCKTLGILAGALIVILIY